VKLDKKETSYSEEPRAFFVADVTNHCRHRLATFHSSHH